MRQEINDFDLEKVFGGIKISRQSPTTGKVYYEGQEYPFTDYSKIVSTAQACVQSGNYTDADLFKAFKEAGAI